MSGSEDEGLSHIHCTAALVRIARHLVRHSMVTFLGARGSCTPKFVARARMYFLASVVSTFMVLRWLEIVVSMNVDFAIDITDFVADFVGDDWGSADFLFGVLVGDGVWSDDCFLDFLLPDEPVRSTVVSGSVLWGCVMGL